MNIQDMPTVIQHFCVQATLQEITVGCSSSQVFRIVHTQGPTYYLKVAAYPFEQELLAEKERLEWLHTRLPAPTVIAYATEKQYAYLLTSEIQGLMAYNEQFAQDIPALVRILAEGLRMLHQVDVTDCPFDETLSRKIALAQERVQAGNVDESDFDEKHRGMSADTLLKQLLESQPKIENIVFTHGDYCLPNVLIDLESMKLSGFIDLGRAGMADSHQDLALVARSLSYNFGPGWEPLLWEAYGLETIDVAKLDFYQLLDEFF